jgi:hypothetical protein
MLLSCEREVSDVAPGEPVTLRFSANEIGYGANENVTRSAGDRVLESVDIAQHGRWTVSADLVEDGISPTRAVEDGLVDGAKVLIVVYNNADVYLDHDVYTFNSSSKALDEAEGDGITVIGGNTYRFAACSYNSTIEAPSYAETISGISPENDLLWGRTNPILISVDDQQVIIGLSHQFMKVRLTTAVSGGTAPVLSNLSASLLSNYKAALTVLSGAVAKGDTAHYAFSGSDLTGPDANLSSDYGLVYTGSDDLIRIKINVTLNDGSDKPFTDLPVSFHKQLEPGHSYTLLVTFRKFAAAGFAASNIYWDGSKLTFDAVANADSSNTRYQGVFFKFGSLVGISPVGSETDAKVYVPSYNGGISPSWSGTLSISTGFTNWDGIPYEQGGSGTDRSANWVTADEQNEPADWTAYTGDICRYISENGFGPGGKWRLPTSAEFGPGAYAWGAATGWEKVVGANGSDAPWSENYEDPSPDGKRTSIRSGGKFMATGNFFPASGGRNIDGTLLSTGEYGYYRSGSVYNATEGYFLIFYVDFAFPAHHGDRTFGFAVRCVLQE